MAVFYSQTNTKWCAGDDITPSTSIYTYITLKCPHCALSVHQSVKPFSVIPNMKVIVQESWIIQPSEETPNCILWTSNVDQLFSAQMPCVYFYRWNGCSNFFDVKVLKDSLGKVLVTFYPAAGRLKKDRNGRAWIDCNGEGVLFIEARTDSLLDDLGDFTPSDELMKLIPSVADIENGTSPPLLFVQVTYFNCGGVSLGVAFDHRVADGTAGTYFMNSWSRIARGLDINIPPVIERTSLRGRDPPTPSFPHIEHQPSPTMKTSVQLQSPETNSKFTSIAMFKISLEQMNILKTQCKEGSSPNNYSSYEVLAAHIWRCSCRARGLEDDQETKLSIATDGRSRLHPRLPYGYFGNAIFHMTPMAKSGDLLSRPLIDTVRKIHDAVVRADDKYIRSALDFLELQPNMNTLIRGSNTFRCPNMAITSWCGLPVHDADFGWGRPLFMGPGSILYEGLGYIIPSPTHDGNVFLAISLLSDHMTRFKKDLYNI